MTSTPHPHPPNPPARPLSPVALVSTAGHCKIACGFCLRADRAHGFLALPTYTRALSRLKDIGVEGICLTGGEPAHHPDLRQLMRLAHQFGILVSVITSARDSQDTERLAGLAPLLANVTVSADSAGAMELGRTTRSVSSALATLKQVHAAQQILHLTYWRLTDQECQDVYRLVEGSGYELQLSPVALDATGRRRAGFDLTGYLAQHRADADLLSRHLQLTPRFLQYLSKQRAVYLHPERVRRCASLTLYVSADGVVRRCPYSTHGVSVFAPRAEIRRFLATETEDQTIPECVAICRAAESC